MNLNDNVISVIAFIEEEFNNEIQLEEVLSRDLSDEEFEKYILEYINIMILEISKTLKLEFEIAKTLYDEYLTKNIIDMI